MPNFKKAVDQSGLNSQTKEYNASVTNKNKTSSRGIGGDVISEPIPNFIQTATENVISNKNNSFIVLGRDRPGSRLSGYGGRGDTQAASIDIVAGRLGFEAKEVDSATNAQVWTDPNFKKDAARVYISQKTDVDKNFGLVNGQVGNSVAKSAIALKADGVRIIAREGIKLITKTDLKNSQGADIKTTSGIDLIAGNDDSDLQPIPKGNNLAEALDRAVQHMDKIIGIIDGFLMIQMEFNEALTHHWHYSPFFALPTTPAIDVVVPVGIKTLIEQLSKIKVSLMAEKANLASFRFNYFNPAGSKYINSRNNNTT
jgi:hypothetical protein